MTKYELIDSIILNLNTINVTGVNNMCTIIDTIQKLSSLQNILKKEDAVRENAHNE